MDHFNSEFEISWTAVLSAAENQFRLGDYTLHGADHWLRVQENALLMASENGADVTLVRLFALLHDCKRLNENHDPRHGARAAEFAAERRGKLFKLADGRFELLHHALEFHDRGMVSEDITIGTCWDADRLDLERVGVIPAAKFMSTEAGRRLVRGRFGGG